MTVGVVIGRSPRTDDFASAGGIGTGIRKLFRSIMEVVGVCARANEAAHLYQSLRPLSDAALAAKGLERSGLPRAAFEKLTGER